MVSEFPMDLSPADIRILLAADIGQRVADTAKILGMSRQRVYQRRARALKILKRHRAEEKSKVHV